MVRANNYGKESTMPPDNPARRVDMLDIDEIMAKVKQGQKVSLCRCYKSKSFPYCDGSHNSHNAETGDNIAPAVLTAGLDDSKRGLDFKTEVCTATSSTVSLVPILLCMANLLSCQLQHLAIARASATQKEACAHVSSLLPYYPMDSQQQLCQLCTSAHATLGVGLYRLMRKRRARM